VILKDEGVNVEGENPNVFLPDEAKMNEDSKTTGVSEFAKDLYESAGVIESSEDDAVCIEPDEADLLAGSTFADDACQHAQIAGDGEWKTPKTTKKGKKPKNPCDKLSLINAFQQIISKATGVPVA